MTPAVGIFNQMWAAVGMSDRDAITTAIDSIRHAEAHGFASVWIGEHHVSPGAPGTFHGRVPAAEVFLAHVAGLTNRIAVGTGVKILSTNAARRSAEEMAMLSLLVPGRVEFGLGQGVTLPGALETRTEKATRYRALLAEILATLRGDLPFSLAPCPEVLEKIWVAARDEPTLAFAAEHGLNLVIGQAEIGLRQVEYVRHYRAAGGRGEVRGEHALRSSPRLWPRRRPTVPRRPKSTSTTLPIRTTMRRRWRMGFCRRPRPLPPSVAVNSTSSPARRIS
jgi:alkanesulfonate monooxygenase SsuD/methylene tetrahydromethanopterin reductase-like flavin-dependent oxidoreductase (luciferase family)